ncbi:hypothetical protein [Nocardioides sp. W7]|uniref:hypothetical protein n=1 Tax=Nocardioides sp. W7 TaxID=2931390 RepID=UPI001FD0E35A|nr:hypothetical protein [Nocardioides sp. W7]
MRPLLVAVVGLVLLVTGVAVMVTANGPADFGWLAYTPLEDDGAYSSQIVLLSPRRLLLGAVVGGLGLAVLAGIAGFHAGRRTRP